MAPRKGSWFLVAGQGLAPQGTPLPGLLCFISAGGESGPKTYQILGGPQTAAQGELLWGEVRR